jgi:hypothetical protein
MSLLRVSQRSLPRTALRSVAARSLATDSNAKTSLEVSDKQSSEITAPPQREVMVADVISGAPGEFIIFVAHINMLIAHSTTSPPCCPNLPTDAQHHAKWGCQGRPLAYRLRHTPRRGTMGESLDGLGELVS